MTDAERPTIVTLEACSCGRPLRLLNPGSDTPRCVGCGFLSAWCRCPGGADEHASG